MSHLCPFPSPVDQTNNEKTRWWKWRVTDTHTHHEFNTMLATSAREPVRSLPEWASACNDNDNGNDTHSEKSIQHLIVARTYRHEWKGHDLTKKSLLKLMGLALLAKYALAHCWWQCVVTSNAKARRNESNTSCCWNKFSEFENRLNPQILCNKTRGARGTWKTAEGNVWQTLCSSSSVRPTSAISVSLESESVTQNFSDSVLIASGLYPVVSASPK